MKSPSDKTFLKNLENAIVDGLENVKAIDIKVFDTTAQTPLFERVIIASGTSNRQTKALAASVKESLKEAGFPKPKVEGETNGEWIIVDCGAAIAHIMQPVFRQYYHLEELWGEHPVVCKPLSVRKSTKTSKPIEAKKVATKAPITKKSVVKKAVVKKSG